ncbi:hypothetical protein Sj15T_12520 [Sphingobium sp. TA15]|uniref:hypothetical protein n=1 Tax=Sphingobium TaxID=165695 RepID=UPI0011D0F946|nr:hypothetical protein [Sphingobium indicum]BDD66231.1 hypothetical protein Sj15T_12520 [Sphingobium sp. TA15]
MSDDIFHTEDSVVEAGLKRFAADQPIVMVNLLHYREVADYGVLIRLSPTGARCCAITTPLTLLR